MHKGIFITGTDTGVGKTFVAAGLLKALRELGYAVCPLKPVETGCRVQNGKFIPEDAVNLIKASKVNEPIDIINPYRFRHPLAPSVAADLEKKLIKKKKIFSVYNYLLKKYDIIIVEGAGGIMVPLNKKYLFLHLIQDLCTPVIIVARSGLGTINHTLLTIEAAKNRGIDILGVIINHSTTIKEGLAEKSNPNIIESLGKVPVLGVVPYSKNHALNIRIFREIAENLRSW